MSQLKEYYQKEVVPGLFETFKYKNIMQVPKLDKVVLNMGLAKRFIISNSLIQQQRSLK